MMRPKTREAYFNLSALVAEDFVRTQQAQGGWPGNAGGYPPQQQPYGQPNPYPQQQQQPEPPPYSQQPPAAPAPQQGPPQGWTQAPEQPQPPLQPGQIPPGWTQ
jgi:hypothetical protein